MTTPKKKISGQQPAKTNLFERHIQNILAEKLDVADEKIIADAIKTMLYQDELEKNIH